MTPALAQTWGGNMITLIGGFILKAFVGTALEGSVGKFVAGKLFGPFLMLLAAGGLYLAATQGVPAMIRAHDARIADQAKKQLATAMQLELTKAKAAALEAAVQTQAETLKAREGDLEALRVTLEEMEKEKRNAREASPNGTAVVIAPGDPWLRPRSR